VSCVPVCFGDVSKMGTVASGVHNAYGTTNPQMIHAWMYAMHAEPWWNGMVDVHVMTRGTTTKLLMSAGHCNDEFGRTNVSPILSSRGLNEFCHECGLFGHPYKTENLG
jgi:hypothetical protein